MLHYIVLFIFMVSVTLAQPKFPLPADLQILTPDNVARLQPLASLGSDTPVDVLWSPDGDTLAAVTFGHVFLFSRADMSKPFLSVPRPLDEPVGLENDFLTIGKNFWNIPGKADVAPEFDKTYASPNGKWFIGGTTEDGQLIVTAFDTASSKQIQLEIGLSGQLDDVVFSPESRYAALKFTVMSDTWSGNQEVQLWDLDAPKLITKIDEFDRSINLMAFYANARFFVMTALNEAYGGYDDVQVVDMRSGELIKFNDSSSYPPVRFSPDQKLMVFATLDSLIVSNDGYLGMLRYQLPNEEHSSYAELRNPSFSPDSTKLLAQYYDQILVWDVDDVLKNLVSAFDTTTAQNVVPRWTLENEGMIADYSLNMDGTRLTVQTFDNHVRIWDMTQSTPVLKQVLSNMSHAQMSPDSKWIWGDTGGLQNKVLFDANTGELLQTLPTDARLDPRWQYAAYWSNGVVTVVDLGQKHTFYLNPLPDYRGQVEYQDVEQGRAAFTSGKRITVYDLLNGETTFSFEDQNYGGRFQLSPTGQLLLRVSDKAVQILKTDAIDQTLFELRVHNPNSIFFLLPDEKTLAYIDPESTYSYADEAVTYSDLQLWNIFTGKRLAEYSLQGDIQAFATNKAGSLLTIGSVIDRHTASLYTLELAHPQKEPLQLKIPISDFTFFDQLNFSPDGQYLAVTTDSQSYGDGPTGHFYEVMIVNLQQLKAPTTFQSEQAFIIPGLRLPVFSPNGQFLLTSADVDVYNPTRPVNVYFWDFNKQTELKTFKGDSIPAFSPDGSLLAVHNGTATQIYAVSSLQKGEIKPLIEIPDSGGQIKNLAFRPDGKALYLIQESRIQVFGVPS